MPAGEDQERERFAAAVEQGFDAVPPDDEELRRELELVALLRESRAALAPDAEASARMRAKVMAAAATILPAITSTQSSEDEATQEKLGDTTDTAEPGHDDEATTLVSTPVATGRPSAVDDTEETTIIEAEETTVIEAVTDASTPVTESSSDKASSDKQPGDQPEEQPTNVVPISRGRFGRRRGRHRFPPGTARPHRRSQLTITAAAAVMVLAATGGGAMFSQGALPGDSLYGVKQTTESALVNLTPGQGNKAQRQLDYAASRLDEVQELNSASGNPAERGEDISQALRGFNEQTAAGSRMWFASAGTRNAAELRTLANWAQTQSQRLSALRESMPANARADADHSLRLLEDLRTRAQSLSNRQGCDQVTSGDFDQLGPLPAKGACNSKENTLAPSIKPVAPPSSTKSKSTESSGSGSRSSEPSSGGEDSKSDRPKAPELPGLGGLTGNNGTTDGLGQLPGREPARNGELVPNNNPGQQPGVDLQLPLLPIGFQQAPGTPK